MSSYFQQIIAEVSRLKPGAKFTVNAATLGKGWGGFIGALLSNGFTPADRVLENVIGSSATHRYTQDRNGDTTFHRLYLELPEDVRGYVSPDRMGFFDRRPDGLYQHCEARLTPEDESRILCALHGHRWAPAWVMPEPSSGSVCDFSVMSVETTVQLVEGRRCLHCRITG